MTGVKTFEKENKNKKLAGANESSEEETCRH